MSSYKLLTLFVMLAIQIVSDVKMVRNIVRAVFKAKCLILKLKHVFVPKGSLWTQISHVKVIIN